MQRIKVSHSVKTFRKTSEPSVNDVNDHKYTYAIGTMYMDIVSECEKLGDYVVNVVEARMNTRQREA